MIERLEKEAVEINKWSFKYAWVLDKLKDDFVVLISIHYFTFLLMLEHLRLQESILFFSPELGLFFYFYFYFKDFAEQGKL